MVALAVLLSACAPGRDLGLLPEYRSHGYVLGSGDQVHVITFGEDQLTGQFRIDDQGRIAIPLLGDVNAAGLTTNGLADRIRAGLKQKDVLRDPNVSVEVTAYRPVFVLGEVSKPGQYAYEPGATMLTVIAIAGGYTYRAYKDYVSVIRVVGDHTEQGRASPSALVAPGDVINVFERHF